MDSDMVAVARAYRTRHHAGSNMFDSARLKIERAYHHISGLETEFAAFVQTNPYSLAVGTNPKTGQAAVRINFKQSIPALFALIIGDAIHNLRTALDHMTWELIGRDGGKQNRYLILPTGDNRINFESRCKGIETPTQAVRDTLMSLEIFPTGKGEMLYALSLLDNADKHTVLTPVIRAAKISLLTIHNATGEAQRTFIDHTLIGGDGPFMNVAKLYPGQYVELGDNAKANPEIFFGDIEALSGEPVIPTLRQLADITASAIHFVESAVS